MGYKDLAKDAVIIGITQVMVNLGNFLLLPFITNGLSTNDYGLWTQVLVIISLLSSVAMLGQVMTILRFMRAKDDKRSISTEYFTVVGMVTLGSACLSLPLCILSVPLANILLDNGSYAALLAMAAMIIPLEALVGMNYAYFRAMGKIRTFAALSIFHAFGEISLILVFVLGGLGVFGAVLGSLVIGILAFSIGFALVVHQVGITRPSWKMARRNMKFGLPLAPNNIIRWVIQSSDRILVNLILGLTMAGIYSAAYNIGGVMFLIVAPIQMILYPTLAKLYDEGNIDEVKEYMRRSFRYYMMLAMPAVVGLSILASPIMIAMTNPNYAIGAIVIPLVAIAGLANGMFKFVENVTHLVKKTHLNLITFGFPALTDVVLVLVLTPHMGIAGAALATTISYIEMLIIGVLISRKFLRFSVEWNFVLKSAAASLAMIALILLINPSNIMGIALAIAVSIPAYFAMLYVLRGFTRVEVDIVKEYIHRALAWKKEKRLEH
ncbi:MAG: oligosaccharide flippase family protein [Methanomassiliicoccus sp.]|nr:oligosaccharide flippase family protein [Methanomassiliicoccus sp.]